MHTFHVSKTTFICMLNLWYLLKWKGRQNTFSKILVLLSQSPGNAFLRPLSLSFFFTSFCQQREIESRFQKAHLETVAWFGFSFRLILSRLCVFSVALTFRIRPSSPLFCETNIGLFLQAKLHVHAWRIGLVKHTTSLLTRANIWQV